MTIKERATEFAVFCIENTAEHLGVPGSVIYNELNSIGGVNGFLFPSYETLHTQSKSYIVDEVLAYMKANNLKTDFAR